MGRIDEVLDDIMRGLPQYLGTTYEKSAAEVLWQHRDRFFPFTASGRWWDRNEEVDLVAINNEMDAILLGAVKWSEKPVGIDIYHTLRQKARRITWGTRGRKEFFCLFSKRGFTTTMLEQANKDGVALFHEDRMIR